MKKLFTKYNKEFTKIAILFFITMALFVTNTSLVPNEIKANNVINLNNTLIYETNAENNGVTLTDVDPGGGGGAGWTILPNPSLPSIGNSEGDMKSWVNGIYQYLFAVGTILACALITWCLIVRMVSKNQKSIESATGWLKMILITYFCFCMVGLVIKMSEAIASHKDTTMFDY